MYTQGSLPENTAASDNPAPGAAVTKAPVLGLRNVGIYYQRRGSTRHWALRDVSLTLLKGETLGVIGRNGAGKSTLLRLLAGIIRPDRGEYINHGYQASLLSLQLGFVNYLSGRENIVLSGLLLGMHLSDIKKRIDEIIDFAELEEFIDEPIETYSSGMRARLGFSAAFHVDPDILLIDEVFGVGDAEFVEKSKAVLQDRIRSDKTVVLVSHNTNVIRSLCDRAVLIEKGCTVLEGLTEEVVGSYMRSLKGQPKEGDAG